MKQVLSYGGGVQSTAIAALIIQGKIKAPDMIVIVDTLRERGTTWTYLNEIVWPELGAIGVKLEIVSNDYLTPAGNNFMSHNQNTLLVGCWTNQSGEVGKLTGYCSGTWKRDVRNRHLSRSHKLTRSKYRVWIGFSLDEHRRAARMVASPEGVSDLIHFPLFEDYPLTRQNAIAEVESLGWPTPPRSRCWMCPNQSELDWAEIKLNAPNEFDLACEFEKTMQRHDPCAWLHKKCIPLGEIDFTAEPNLFDSGGYCDSGQCFV